MNLSEQVRDLDRQIAVEQRRRAGAEALHKTARAIAIALLVFLAYVLATR